MNILILTGGSSSERTVSLISAKSVKNALIENGHKVKIYDLKNSYQNIIHISKNFDILFPVLHGEEGEGGELHKFLGKLNKPIVGTRNYKGLKEGWYKLPFKKFCQKNNIPTAKWKPIRTQQDIISFGFPCVLKASNGGSSREVQILKLPKDLKSNQCMRLIKSTVPLYVETYLQGTEITVGILGNIALPVIQVVAPKGSWLSYKTKYSGKTRDIADAPSLDAKTKKLAQKITLMIHNKLQLGDYSRTDFIVYKNIPYALEVNTIPGLTPISAFPKAASAAKIKYNCLIENLVRFAVKR
jgi:D-alanine-D-alanine ligase